MFEQLNLPGKHKAVLEEAIKWSEASKGGLPHQRKQWLKSGYNLFVHNIGSAQIYKEESMPSGKFSPIVETLIATHGLIGQTIRGEVSFSQNKPLYGLISSGKVQKTELSAMLQVLNYCIIAAVDKNLCENIQAAIFEKIDCIANGRFDCELPVKERLRALRSKSIKVGEDFEKVVSGLYYDRNGKKHINLYKKRIIEKYLATYSVEDILSGVIHESPHICHKTKEVPQLDNTAYFEFELSPGGEKLIEFCMEAEKSGVLYEKSIIMLYDLFNLRRDAYDRFYEEENYLKTMNQSINGKRVLLDYITGQLILDIGPGGGALMDLIEEHCPKAKVAGIDVSENVIRTLQQKKQRENKKWGVIQGDAFHLSEIFKPGDADTIIFCSIIMSSFPT